MRLAHQMPFEARFSLSAERQAITRLRVIGLTVIAFVLFSLIGPTPLASDATSLLIRNSGDLVKQAVLLGLFAILLFAQFDQRNLWVNLAIPASVLILLGYCLLSVSWAIDPGISIRRLGLTAITIWFFCRAVSLLGYARMLECLRIALIIMLILNYATVALSSHGIHQFGVDVEESVIGSWRGLLDHKNVAGPVCAMTVLIFLFDGGKLDPALRYFVVVLAAVFLWFTQSKTSMSALAVATAAGALLPPLLDLRRSFRLVILVMAVVGAIQVLSIYLGDLIIQLDDPGAFTGRSQIWLFLVEYAQTHLWFGAGFGSFWQIGNAGPIWDYTSGWVAEVTGAGHNGYLDILVTIGLPGLILTVVVMFLLPIAQLWLGSSMPRPQRGLLLALIVFVLLHNLGESQLLDRTAFDQEILVFVIALIASDRTSPSLAKGLMDRIAILRQRAFQGRAPI